MIRLGAVNNFIKLFILFIKLAIAHVRSFGFATAQWNSAEVAFCRLLGQVTLQQTETPERFSAQLARMIKVVPHHSRGVSNKFKAETTQNHHDVRFACTVRFTWFLFAAKVIFHAAVSAFFALLVDAHAAVTFLQIERIWHHVKSLIDESQPS
jgi:hypothetical protein